ncbi:MAG: transport-associated protein [Rhodospirillaceae bacterium]|nr:MAG: transport-associated protein [Rhodospirillaceae bacterium]TNC94921.1 MAG: transport-associated protein [Stygiobacter sp.]
MAYQNRGVGKILAVLAVVVALSGCTVFSGRETAGEYVDDATITTRVKAAIFNDPGLKSLEISVETMQDVVQLSGFVDSAQSKAKAGEIAGNVEGVRQLRNNLVVR